MGGCPFVLDFSRGGFVMFNFKVYGPAYLPISDMHTCDGHVIYKVVFLGSGEVECLVCTLVYPLGWGDVGI